MADRQAGGGSGLLVAVILSMLGSLLKWPFVRAASLAPASTFADHVLELLELVVRGII